MALPWIASNSVLPLPWIASNSLWYEDMSMTPAGWLCLDGGDNIELASDEEKRLGLNVLTRRERIGCR
ncbi:hypothetical protein PP1Y_Lpl743 (plasmid) [Novosphingobium sp. PP1Y]|nr:hypothetical protein PP1Y_Lpl743 [Novosphingobium sp. PP1Y]